MSACWSVDHDDTILTRSHLTRRQFFGKNAAGLGTAALASLLGRDVPAADVKKQVGGLPGFPSFTPKAKHVIYLLQTVRRPMSIRSITSRGWRAFAGRNCRRRSTKIKG